MKLGLSTYTYTWSIGVPGQIPSQPITALGLLDKAASLDVKLVQFADNLPLDQLSEHELSSLEKYAQDLGIQIELGTRGITQEHLIEYLCLAERFQSPILRVVVDTNAHHPSPDQVIALLKPQIPAFEAAGVKLAIENHDRFSAKTLEAIVRDISSPFLGVCLDTVNSFGALEGPSAVIETLGPLTVNLHVKDFDIRRVDHLMGFVIEGTPAGRGRLNVPELLDQLTGFGCKFNAILELWTPPEKDLEKTILKEDNWAQISVNYLRTLIPE